MKKAKYKAYYLSCLYCVPQSARVHILDTESFENTFGTKAQRKKPHLKVGDLQVYHKNYFEILINVLCLILQEMLDQVSKHAGNKTT